MAETVKHTPGPWVAERGGGKGAWIKGSDGNWAAMSCGTDNANADANAILIAAAPEMLEALDLVAGLLLWNKLDETSVEVMRRVNSVRAKAEVRS